jgi:hypothetical protein
VADADLFEAILIAFQRDDFGAGVQLDVRRGLDPLDQVAGHGGRQAVLADQHVHLGRKPDRNTAACPAELPPPTRMISSVLHSLASTGEAQ